MATLVQKEREEIERRNAHRSHCLQLFSVTHFLSDIDGHNGLIHAIRGLIVRVCEPAD